MKDLYGDPVMSETDYAWGSERPSARRARLKRQIEATQALKAAAAEAYARKLAEIDALEAVRVADLEEVDVMTHGGAAPYDRSLEADPKIANRPRVENTQAVYGRGAKLKRSTLPTRVIAVGDDALQIRKGAKGSKASARKRTAAGKARPVAPEATAQAASSEVVDTVEMVPPGTSAQEPTTVAPESGIVVPEAALDPVSEPVSEPETIPAAPMILPSQIRAVAALYGAPGTSPARTGNPAVLGGWVVEAFSAEVEAERAQLIVPGRLPKGYDPTWADHWVENPNAPLPEMLAAFQAFGAAIDKSPEDLTDEEAYLLGAAAMFPTLTWDRATRTDVPNPRAFRRGEPVDTFRWDNEIRRSGGTVQKLVAKWYRSVDDLRTEERTRRAMWPLALARRDLIKTLMTEVALGTLSFAPRSMRMADLDRSVQWNVFRRADHEPLVVNPHYNVELYHQRILDNLPWPEGLSRRELLAQFGAGASPDKVRGLSYASRPPHWLVPDHLWLSSTAFRPLTIEREPHEPGGVLPPPGGELEDVPGISEVRLMVCAGDGERGQD